MIVCDNFLTTKTRKLSLFLAAFRQKTKPNLLVFIQAIFGVSGKGNKGIK